MIAGLLNEYKPARANHKAVNYLVELKRDLVSPGKTVRGFTVITKPPPGRFISTKRRSRVLLGLLAAFNRPLLPLGQAKRPWKPAAAAT